MTADGRGTDGRTSATWRVLLAISSGRLALWLVLLLIVCAVAGAVMPQQGALDPADLAQWRVAHPRIDAWAHPAGLYNVFHAWGFLVLLLVLGINTLACTVLHAIERRSLLLTLSGRAHWFGFVLLHLSLVMLIAGGLVSGATRLSGRIVLIEGQTFDEKHSRYQRLAEGPLRPRRDGSLVLNLYAVDVQLAQGRYTVDVTSRLGVQSRGGDVTQGQIKVNYPFTHAGVTFTQDRTGYAPRIVVRDRHTGRTMMNSFVALTATRTAGGTEHRDYLPLPFLERRTILTLYPGHALENGAVVKTGDEPESPILVMVTAGEDGTEHARTYIRLGQEATVGRYTFAFTGLRRWSALGVTQDAGYVIVCVALWIGLAALLLRYLPELSEWLRESDHDND